MASFLSDAQQLLKRSHGSLRAPKSPHEAHRR